MTGHGGVIYEVAIGGGRVVGYGPRVSVVNSGRCPSRLRAEGHDRSGVWQKTCASSIFLTSPNRPFATDGSWSDAGVQPADFIAILLTANMCPQRPLWSRQIVEPCDPVLSKSSAHRIRPRAKKQPKTANTMRLSSGCRPRQCSNRGWTQNPAGQHPCRFKPGLRHQRSCGIRRGHPLTFIES